MYSKSVITPGRSGDILSDRIADIERLRELTFYAGIGFVQLDSAVVDLGCAAGDAVKPFIQACDDSTSFVLADIDEDYLTVARDLYGGDPRARFDCVDLTKTFPAYSTSLILAVCTLQYIPLGYRWRVLRSAYNSLLPGGALIVAEQVIGPGWLNEVYEATNASLIVSKGRYVAIERDCTPVSLSQNESMLHDAGFRIVDGYFKSLNYAGWIALKDE